MTDSLSAQKKVELLKKLEEEKKKELEELKKKQAEEERELEEARSRLEESMEELEDETEALAGQAEEEHKKRLEEEINSIDDIAEQQPEKVPTAGLSYDGLDRLWANNLYELTDYNAYNELKRLEEKDYLSIQEQERLQEFQNQLGSIQDSYSQDHINNLDDLRGGYISRTENILQRLNDKMHNLDQKGDYSQGEYRW